MAEVLGVVSSAIAVAELAGKFGLSVMKLKQLWDEIQDIPEEMNRIMRQLEILKPVLAGMEADFVQQQRHKVYSNSATNLNASIEYCRDAFNDLESLAEDLQARISTAKRSRRNITKLKVSFKKEDIRKAFMKSQPVVQLVQDPEPSSLDTVVDDAHEVQTDTSHSDRLETIRPTRYEVGPKPLPWQKPSFFGGFTYKQSQNPFYANSTVHQLRLQLPTWVSQRVFDLQTYRANVGWQICLEPWIKRGSIYGKIFNDVRYGKLLDVEKALAAGEISLFDRDRSGGTLLHIAAYGGKLDTFKALLSWGLSPEETDDRGQTAAQHIYGTPGFIDTAHVTGAYGYSNTALTGIGKTMMGLGALEEEIDIMFSGARTSQRYAFPYYIWRVPGVIQTMTGDRYQEYLKLSPQPRFAYLSWSAVRPEVLLQQVSLSASITPAALRAVEGHYDKSNLNPGRGLSLQALAENYFCEMPIGLWDSPWLRRDGTRGKIGLIRFHKFYHWRKL
ncbi:hypothetical protein CGCA056_v003372 [Colletotrichum aenigma]|uniref:uncharacterized protein n=1 Tax=Colletotrichum aenigma TaxID=1215731 RepID=UPI001872CB6B|nr:uncharacterized protein CGCA056_v003372 [Colletotrichum aenigma]KAF5525655.1 hypothetical protein CGCA056_v003372 [Colletotrichum aenigma]